MRREIVGYGVDDEGDTVAVLECGHTQHVRHDPPMVWREWATTSEGRRRRLGKVLNCSDCDRDVPTDVENPQEIDGVEKPQPL